MRVIRSDLEERANIIQEQERDTRVADLNQTLAVIDKLMEFESGVMAKVVTLENLPAPQPSLTDRIRASN